MKKRHVEITSTAQADTLAGFEFIWAHSPPAAARWLKQLHAETKKLETFAAHAPARECVWLGDGLRQVVFKSHRIVYTVDPAKEIVYVLYVRHQAQRAVGEPKGND